MKKIIKPIVFTILLLTFLILLFLPVKVPAATYKTGMLSGNDCWCTMPIYWTCVCVYPN